MVDDVLKGTDTVLPDILGRFALKLHFLTKPLRKMFDARYMLEVRFEVASLL